MLEKTLGGLAAIALVVLVVIGAAALAAFPAMIIIGIIHGYQTDVPAIGLWNTWAWLALVGIVGSRFNTTKVTQ